MYIPFVIGKYIFKYIIIRVFAKRNFASFAMRKFAKCQNTEFRIFANNRIIAKFREIVLFSHHFRMFCIAKDAKFIFAWKP